MRFASYLTRFESTQVDCIKEYNLTICLTEAWMSVHWYFMQKFMRLHVARGNPENHLHSNWGQCPKVGNSEEFCVLFNSFWDPNSWLHKRIYFCSLFDWSLNVCLLRFHVENFIFVCFSDSLVRWFSLSEILPAITKTMTVGKLGNSGLKMATVLFCFKRNRNLWPCNGQNMDANTSGL